MKKETKIEIAVLIILFILIFGGISFFVHHKIEKPNLYEIKFKDIDSIVKGSPVRFMGINVGHVVKLKRKDDHIICKIRITKKGVVLPSGTKAHVEFNGLGGSKSVELMPPDTNAENTGIVAQDSLRINDFVSVIKDLREVCITINNMVQKMDTNEMSKTMKTMTNPESITNIDNSMDKTVQDALDKEKGLNKFLNSTNKFLNIKKGE